MEDMEIGDSWKDFYKGKRILITGHTGFKGSWLTAMLQYLGANIRGYSLAPEEGHLYQLINGNELCDSLIGDIRDSDNFEKAVLSFSPDLIFHLAAQPLVGVSFYDPSGTISTNITGTVNLLEIIRKSSSFIPTVVVTTDKVYLNNDLGKDFKEDDGLGGKDIYSASKASVEILVNAYNQTFFKERKVVTARAGNVIGGGDFSKDRIMPDFIRASKSEEKLLLRNPKAIRPWQHVLESLSGYLILGQMSNDARLTNTAYNFGPSAEDMVTVERLIEFCNEHSERPVAFEFSKSAYNESKVLNLDSKLASGKLGWNPQWNAYIAIQKTLEWHELSAGTGAYEITLNQIKEYLQKL